MVLSLSRSRSQSLYPVHLQTDIEQRQATNLQTETTDFGCSPPAIVYTHHLYLLVLSLHENRAVEARRHNIDTVRI